MVGKITGLGGSRLRRFLQSIVKTVALCVSHMGSLYLIHILKQLLCLLEYHLDISYYYFFKLSVYIFSVGVKMFFKKDSWHT